MTDRLSYAELQRRALLAGDDAGKPYGILNREYGDDADGGDRA
jgi:hypothetical protein